MVIGRKAMSLGKLPGDLEEAVQGRGASADHGTGSAVCARDLGLRINRQVSRRVFPLPADHPITEGLDGRRPARLARRRHAGGTLSADGVDDRGIALRLEMGQSRQRHRAARSRSHTTPPGRRSSSASLTWRTAR